MIKICRKCGKEFSTSNNKAKFCSVECTRENSKKRVKYKCDGCGKEIETIPSKIKSQKHIFCSSECHIKNIGRFYTKENNSRYKRLEYKCEQCGKSVFRKPSQNRGKHIYCSNECYTNSRIGKSENKVNVKCPICGKIIKVYKSRIGNSERIFCSKECKDIGTSLFYSGEDSPSWDPRKTEQERINKRKFKEYNIWRTNVYKKDKYTCQKCNYSGGGNLNSHHILNYSEHIKHRLDVRNGITFCKNCHKKFHDKYGYAKNNFSQILEFLKEG